MEGPAGVGKTELAKALAAWRGMKMIRMQCYEGLDEAKALYEWKYAKQLLYTQILKDKLGEVLGGADTLAAALGKLHDFGDVFFSKEFVEPRPLLQALEQAKAACCWSTKSTSRTPNSNPCCWKFSADYQVSIPELGTVTAIVKPTVILTSNGERDLSDALKRRCLHLHIGFPEQKLEERIVESRVPGISAIAAQADRRLHQPGSRAGPEEAALGQRNHRLGARAGAAAVDSSSIMRPSRTRSTCC